MIVPMIYILYSFLSPMGPRCNLTSEHSSSEHLLQMRIEAVAISHHSKLTAACRKVADLTAKEVIRSGDLAIMCSAVRKFFVHFGHFRLQPQAIAGVFRLGCSKVLVLRLPACWPRRVPPAVESETVHPA